VTAGVGVVIGVFVFGGVVVVDEGMGFVYLLCGAAPGEFGGVGLDEEFSEEY